MRAIFVLFKVEPGHVQEAAEAISGLELESDQLYSITGDYDLIAKFYVKSFEELAEAVTEKLQKVPYVRETKTMLTFNPYFDPHKNRPRG